MTTAELNILVRVRAAEAQAEIARLRSQLAMMDAQIKRTQASSNGDFFSNLSKSGSRMQWVGRQLSTYLTLPLALAAGMAVKWGIENEKALARVGKLYGDASQSPQVLANELKALDKVTTKLSEAFGVNKKVVLDIAGDWAAAGSSGEALAKSIGLTLRTMVVGEMDATEATRALIAIQAQYGASIDGTGKSVDGLADKTGGLTKIINQLNAVENVTGTKLNDLVIAYSRAAGVARTAGVTTGELAAMVSALTPAAGTASEAGTSLKTMISRLLSPTKEAADVMKEMKLQIDETSWNSLTATERLKVLADEFQNLKQGQKAVASSLIASRYHINKFEVLMESIANPVGYFAKSMGIVNDELAIHQIAQKELQTVLNTSSKKIEIVGQIMKNSLTDAFKDLIPIIVWISQAMATLFQKFTALNPAVQKLVIVIALLLAALGPMIILMGLMKLAIGQLAPMFIALARFMLMPLAPLKLLIPAMTAPFVLASWAASRLAVLTAALFVNRAALGGWSVAGYLARAAMVVVHGGLLLVINTAMAVPAALAAARAALVAFATSATVVATVTKIAYAATLAATWIYYGTYFGLMLAWSRGVIALQAGTQAARIALAFGYFVASLAAERAYGAAKLAVVAFFGAAITKIDNALIILRLALNSGWGTAALAADVLLTKLRLQTQRLWAVATLGIDKAMGAARIAWAYTFGAAITKIDNALIILRLALNSGWGTAALAGDIFITKARVMVQSAWAAAVLLLDRKLGFSRLAFSSGWGTAMLALDIFYAKAKLMVTATFGPAVLAMERALGTARILLTVAFIKTMLALEAGAVAVRKAIASSYWIWLLVNSKAWQATMLVLTSTYHTFVTAMQVMYQRIQRQMLIMHYMGLGIIERTWNTVRLAAAAIFHATWIAGETLFHAARAGVMVVYNRLIVQLFYAWSFAMLAIQKVFSAAWLTNFLALMAKTLILFRTGFTGILAMAKRVMMTLLAVLVGPWGLAIAAVVALIVMFKDQIWAAIQGIIGYFQDIPKGVQEGFAPVMGVLSSIGGFFSRVFNGIKDVTSRAFNALPDSIKNALMKVVATVRAAALAVYNWMKYMNPFQRHSPSLVESVTAGMEIVGDKFGAAAARIKTHVMDMYRSMAQLNNMLNSGALGAEKEAQRQDKRTSIRTVDPSALGAYDDLTAKIKTMRGDLDDANEAIERQEEHLKSLQAEIDSAETAIEGMTATLDGMKRAADGISAALDKAKDRFQFYADAQIAGTRATEDAIFDNEMAQKRLQLQIARMGDTSDIDSARDAYAKLQGEIEMLSGTQKELRTKGAGSEILGPYEAMIASLEGQQKAVEDGTGDAASQIERLNNELEKLQNKAEIMDLEKSLKFDGLNRQIDAFTDKTHELPFQDIMSGLRSSSGQVDVYTMSLENANAAIAAQEAAIESAQAARDGMKDNYDLEADKLQTMKDIYDNIEESIRAGEQALEDMVSTADAAIQRAEEAARKAEEAKKKKKGAGEDEISPGLQNFLNAGTGDFEDTGDVFTVGREGDTLDQSGDMLAYADNLAAELGTGLGGFDMFGPIKDMWNSTWAWIKNTFGPIVNSFGTMFGDLGPTIAAPFKAGEDGVSRMGQLMDTAGGWFSALWDPIAATGEALWNLFGPEIIGTFKEAWGGLTDIWNDVWPALKGLFVELGPLVQQLIPYLGWVVAAFLGVVQVAWDMLNGAIRPVFKAIGEIIAAVINVIKGVVEVITGVLQTIGGALQFIFGVVQTVVGVFALLTGNTDILKGGLENMGSGIVNFFKGIGTALEGVFHVLGGIWDAIFGLFRGAINTIVGVVKGFVTGIYDFFYWLWDTLVGHSIVPDMINAIIDWFLKLPGRILGAVLGFVNDVFDYFQALPGRILDALARFQIYLSGVFEKAFQYVRDLLPSWAQKIFDFYTSIPGRIVDALGNIAEIGVNLVQGFWEGILSKGAWLVDKIKTWVKDHIPGPIKWALDINSPSGVTEELGGHTADGLALGIENGTPAVTDAVHNMGTAAADAAAKAAIDTTGSYTGAIEASLPKVDSALKGLGDIITYQALPAVPMTDVLTEFIKSTDDAKAKLDILKQGLQAFRTETVTQQDVQQQVNDTMRETAIVLDGFSNSMILANGHIDTTTETGSKMYSQMKDVQGAFDGAAASAYQSAIDQGLSMDAAAAAAVDASRRISEQFIQQAIDAGIPEEAAKRLAQTYDLIPENIWTKFDVDLDEADAAVRNWMEQDRLITFRANIQKSREDTFDSKSGQQKVDDGMASYWSNGGTQAGAEQYRKDLEMKYLAAGGWVSGAGTTTSDSIFAMLSNKEFVVQASMAQKYAAILEQINAGTYEASAAVVQLPEFADGGAVGKAMTTASNGSTQLVSTMDKATAESKAEWDAYVAYMTTSAGAFKNNQTLTIDQMGQGFVDTYNEMYGSGTALTAAYTASSAATMKTFSDGTVGQFSTMSTGVTGVLDTMSKSLVNTTTSLGGTLLDSFATTNKNITDQFNNLSSNMNTTMNDGIKPMFESFDPTLQTVTGWFENAVGNIGTVWSGIQEPVAVPARFVINDVYNDGIRGAWNSFNNFLDLAPLPEHIARFATGGPVFGAGTATSDSIPALLSNQEHVITAREVQGAGGHGAVQQVRQMWARGETPAFARGGPVDLNAAPWGGGGGEGNLQPAAILARRNVHKYWPEIDTIGGYRAYDAYPDHPSGLALDIMTGDPIGTQVNDWLHREKDALALNYTIWKQFYKPAGGGGNMMEDRGSITQNHYDHIHALFNSNGIAGGIPFGGVGSLPMDQVVRDGINARMDAVLERAPQIAGGIGEWIPKSIEFGRNHLLDFMVPLAEAQAKSIAGSGAIGNAESWRPMAIEAMKRNGFAYNNDEQVNAMLRQIMSESTGNAKAIQQVIDINSGGNEAAGLLQITPKTWAAFRDPALPDDRLDAWANMNGALRYYKSRYGMDLTTNWGRGHGYDEGGILEPTPGGYGTYYNHTGKPEMVLTQSDWDAIYAAANNPVDVKMIEEGNTKAILKTAELSQEAVEAAITTGSIDAATTWTPAIYDASKNIDGAAHAMEVSADSSKSAMDEFTKVGGEVQKYTNAVLKFAQAIHTANISQEQTFDTWVPVINGAADLLAMLPDAEPTYMPWAGYDAIYSPQMKVQEGLNTAANVGKGVYQLFKDVAPTLLRHTATIGSAVTALVTQNGPIIAAAIAMFPANPVGAAIMLIPVILQAIFSLVPLIISAVLDIVPTLFSAIKKFIQQFMPGAVKTYDDIAAAQDAVIKNEASIKENIANPGKWANPNETTVRNTGGTDAVNINIYGDVTMPNVTNNDGATVFVDNLTNMAKG